MPANKFQKFTIQGFAQGTTYSLTYYSADSIITKQQLDSIFNALDNSLSLYNPNSVINKYNHSDEGIIADEHLNTIIKKAVEVYNKTDGLFDITIGALTEAWGFGSKKIEQPPDTAAVQQLLQSISSKNLEWDGQKWKKNKNCFKLDPNGISQGYTDDVISNYLERRGVNDYLIEVGGEIRVHGRKQPGGQMMTVGIEWPDDNEFMPNSIIKTLQISGGAITTSGNYRKYYESNGKKVSHIINPKTGFAQNNELISVTVLAKDGITADAYDNSLMLMGLAKALNFVKNNNEIEACFIFRTADGKIKDTTSSGFYSQAITQ